MSVEQTLHDIIFAPWLTMYYFIQNVIDWLLSPTPPAPSQNPGHRKIAVIGAGLTGVSAASHCVGHGFDVHIFEAGDRDAVGGIWAVSREDADGVPSQLILTTYRKSITPQAYRLTQLCIASSLL